MPAMFACIDSTLPITLAEQKLTQTHTKANEFPNTGLENCSVLTVQVDSCLVYGHRRIDATN